MEALPDLRDLCPPTDAFEQRLVAEAPAVSVLLRRLAGRDGEDLAQETLARALRSRQSYCATRPMGAWLARIARNVFLDHIERGGRTPRPEGDVMTAPSKDSGPVQRSSDRAELQHALASLGTMEREILMRFHAANESVREIATRLQIPEGTVKSLMHRARRRLAAVDLAESGEGDQ